MNLDMKHILSLCQVEVMDSKGWIMPLSILNVVELLFIVSAEVHSISVRNTLRLFVCVLS